jgi:hypothetical protein
MIKDILHKQFISHLQSTSEVCRSSSSVFNVTTSSNLCGFQIPNVRIIRKEPENFFYSSTHTVHNPLSFKGKSYIVMPRAVNRFYNATNKVCRTTGERPLRPKQVKFFKKRKEPMAKDAEKHPENFFYSATMVRSFVSISLVCLYCRYETANYFCKKAKALRRSANTFCSPTKAVCTPTNYFCSPIKAVCTPTNYFCSHTKAVCTPTNYFCSPTKAVCTPAHRFS